MASLLRSSVVLVSLVITFRPVQTLAVSPRFRPRWTQAVKVGLEQRLAADPDFLRKSVAEVLLAAGTQVAAELERRGPGRMLPEIDFVAAGVLTAIYGKYSAMWKVAPTKVGVSKFQDQPRFGDLPVPTNAFQPYLLDGMTRPTVKQRLASMLVPVAPLFRAGLVASFLGYGATALMMSIRGLLFPSYEAATQSVNIVYASLYTGGFMALVSNLRYQILQGIIEPQLSKIPFKFVEAVLVFLVRLLNGFLGSVMAISGMRMLGLQKLR